MFGDSGEALPPPYPDRLRQVTIAFARFAYKTDIEMHGGKVESEVTIRE